MNILKVVARGKRGVKLPELELWELSPSQGLKRRGSRVEPLQKLKTSAPAESYLTASTAFSRETKNSHMGVNQS